MSSKPRIFSFFAGSGFLDLGFELNGFDIGYVNEIYAPFIQAYRYSREYMKIPAPKYGYHEKDVTNLIEGEEALNLCYLIQDARKDASIIGFIGGPPCPDFSIGGKNRGKEGDKGKLSACYVELICQQKPDFFLFENVKGLWSTKKHRIFFEQLKHQLIQSGYVLVERLINAIEYGVPQDRERIILVGFRTSLINDLGIKINNNIGILPEAYFAWDKYIIHPINKVFSLPWPIANSFKENSLLPHPDSIPLPLTVEYWFKENDVLHHPNTEHHFQPKAGINKFASVDEGDVSKKSFKRLHRWRYSPTACYGNNEVHLHPYKIRRLSAAEALAIQSLPKNFILPDNMSLTNMFKTIGNGVPYLAAQAIAKTLLDFLETRKWDDEVLVNQQLELPLIFR
ncbi:DNA cytosine methyltransferase [Aerosakkonemataceae cyanobacterium BLCC-F154]|uniref:DNA (cytosine-5-)-methyltransferase n=1 Tax=Floridaenema fluviatile BLCC-F154 TaxID=3153640 RepID=A0ABV4YAC4_9CYAN